MSYFLSFILLLISMSTFAATPLASLIDMLRETPAQIQGAVKLSETTHFYKGKSGFLNVGMNIQGNKDLGFSFSEDHLTISTESAIQLTIQGIPLKVTNISYFAKTGKFEVKTDTPLGLGEKTLAKSIEKFLDEKYRPKLISAFNEIKKIRAQNNSQDITKIIDSVVDIFATKGEPVPLPKISGNVELIFFPTQDKTLRLNDWKAEIKAGDRISAGVNFIREGKKLTLEGFEMNSKTGIRFTGKTSFPEIVSINFNSLKMNGQGSHFDYDLGAEEVLVGFRLLLDYLKNQQQNPDDLCKECDPVKLDSIRKSLDNNLRKQISLMIKSHRKSLLASGVSAEFLAALE